MWGSPGDRCFHQVKEVERVASRVQCCRFVPVQLLARTRTLVYCSLIVRLRAVGFQAFFSSRAADLVVGPHITRSVPPSPCERLRFSYGLESTVNTHRAGCRARTFALSTRCHGVRKRELREDGFHASFWCRWVYNIYIRITWGTKACWQVSILCERSPSPGAPRVFSPRHVRLFIR
jgi:hypothetical protein